MNAIELPIAECEISVSCGRDGTWLHFRASTGKSAAINVDALVKDGNYGIIKRAITDWCADRQSDAKKIAEDNGQFGVGA
jgi:hypothetical protein